MDGVITFFSSQQVFKGEKVLKDKNIIVEAIPGPREISPNCGVALCFYYKNKDIVISILQENKILFEEVHYYPELKKYSKWLDV